MRSGRRIIVAIAAFALLPMLIMMLVAPLAALLGCQVTDIGPTECIVLGTDAGGLLYAALNAGSFALITIPFLMLIVVLWLLVEAFVARRRRRKARRANLRAATPA